MDWQTVFEAIVVGALSSIVLMLWELNNKADKILKALRKPSQEGVSS